MIIHWTPACPENLRLISQEVSNHSPERSLPNPNFLRRDPLSLLSTQTSFSLNRDHLGLSLCLIVAKYYHRSWCWRSTDLSNRTVH